MLTLPPDLQAELDSGATTLAWCWRVTRRDGQVFGFTDHDGALEFDGIAFQPESGFSAADLDTRLGLESASSEVTGLFDSAAIAEADLAAGLWDCASVALYRVDWRDPARRVRTWTGELGAIRHDGESFRAELNGFSRRLDRAIGRIYSRHCDAEFGDARCGIDAGAPAYSGSGLVTALLPRGFAASGLDGFADDWFRAGKLVWTSGALAGAARRIAWHRKDGTEVLLGLDEPAGVEPGASFDIVAGCDKQHPTCRDKFANIVNFRGFAAMPGVDVLIAGPAGETVHDGGARGLS